MLNQTLLVLVLYKTKLSESDTFNTLSKAIGKYHECVDILVYDNSPIPDDTIKSTFANWNIIYKHNKLNPGVSIAYNYGFSIANKLKKKWLLVLDQDTSFDEEIFQAYENAVSQFPEEAIFAPILMSGSKIISPCKFFLHKGFHLKMIEAGKQRLVNKSPVNSGMLISIDLLNKAGGYNEKVKLDYSDFAFIKRASKFIKSFVVIDSIANHQISTEINVSIDANLNRYRFFCEGVALSAESMIDKILSFNVTFIRAFNLTYKHKDLIFLKYFIKFWRANVL